MSTGMRWKIATMMLIAGASIARSQERFWIVTFADHSFVDSLALDTVVQNSVAGSRGGLPAAIPLDSVVELRYVNESKTAIATLGGALAGLGFGALSYENSKSANPAERESPDLLFRLGRYAGGLVLGAGVGGLVGTVLGQDEVYAVEGMNAKAKTSLVRFVLHWHERTSPSTMTIPSAIPTPMPERKTSETHSVSVMETEFARNSLFVEALGPGLLYSINYERFASDNFSGRIGVSYFKAGGSEQTMTLVTVPILATYLIGSGSSRLEVGFGIDVIAEFTHEYSSWSMSREFLPESSHSETMEIPVASVGYRYQPPTGGLQFRLVVTPVFASSVFFWMGTSIGASF